MVTKNLILCILPSKKFADCAQYNNVRMGQHHYRPKRSFGQGNIFTPVCHSVHRGGGLARRTPPRHGGTPPRACPPRHGEPHPGMEERPPPGMENPPPPRSRLRHTVYDRPVRILLECILVHLCVCIH